MPRIKYATRKPAPLNKAAEAKSAPAQTPTITPPPCGDETEDYDEEEEDTPKCLTIAQTLMNRLDAHLISQGSSQPSAEAYRWLLLDQLIHVVRYITFATQESKAALRMSLGAPTRTLLSCCDCMFTLLSQWWSAAGFADDSPSFIRVIQAYKSNDMTVSSLFFDNFRTVRDRINDAYQTDRRSGRRMLLCYCTKLQGRRWFTDVVARKHAKALDFLLTAASIADAKPAPAELKKYIVALAARIHAAHEKLDQLQTFAMWGHNHTKVRGVHSGNEKDEHLAVHSDDDDGDLWQEAGPRQLASLHREAVNESYALPLIVADAKTGDTKAPVSNGPGAAQTATATTAPMQPAAAEKKVKAPNSQPQIKDGSPANAGAAPPPFMLCAEGSLMERGCAARSQKVNIEVDHHTLSYALISELLLLRFNKNAATVTVTELLQTVYRDLTQGKSGNVSAEQK